MITKTEPIGDHRIPDILLSFAGEPPRFNELSDHAQWFDREAEHLFTVLLHTLPGGTLDRLLGKLLAHRASLFVVP
jgi:hypothetical protein